jgi:hypothetical protein
MSFCCPIHGYYTPTPGITLALCPTCSSPIAELSSAREFRACAEYEQHSVQGMTHDTREAAEQDLRGWLPPYGRARRGWIEERKVGPWREDAR